VPLPDGYFWICLGKGARAVTVAERRTEGGGVYVYWSLPGSDDYFLGDRKIDVLAGPLLPPMWWPT
jgi:hypothetical protein